MAGIKVFVIFPMGSFHFPIMLWRKRLDLFMAYTVFLKPFLKHRQRAGIAAAVVLGEFRSVVRLYTFYVEGKRLKHMVQKYRRGIGGNLLKCFHISKPGELVYGGVLVIFL